MAGHLNDQAESGRGCSCGAEHRGSAGAEARGAAWHEPWASLASSEEGCDETPVTPAYTMHPLPCRIASRLRFWLRLLLTSKV